MIHLAKEAALAGPVHMRWMFPIERLIMYIIKDSLTNSGVSPIMFNHTCLH